MEGNRRFTIQDALIFQKQVIDKWEPSSEVWPYSYGNDILGIMSTLGSGFMTHFLRKELKIRPYARLTCYSPALGLPAMACYLFQSVIITPDILTKNGCPLCITTKATLAQAVIGVAFPLTVSTITCLYVADRLLTYPVPPLLKAPKEVFLLFQKLVQKKTRAFSIICAVNMVAASFITYQKQNILFKLDLTPKKKFLL